MTCTRSLGFIFGGDPQVPSLVSQGENLSSDFHLVCLAKGIVLRAGSISRVKPKILDQTMAALVHYFLLGSDIFGDCFFRRGGGCAASTRS
jgi:hypothetical protein